MVMRACGLVSGTENVGRFPSSLFLDLRFAINSAFRHKLCVFIINFVEIDRITLMKTRIHFPVAPFSYPQHGPTSQLLSYANRAACKALSSGKPTCTALPWA